jgi:hypothetical protein
MSKARSFAVCTVECPKSTWCAPRTPYPKVHPIPKFWRGPRFVISNDRNSMVGFAYRRVAAGESVPGVIATTNEQSIGLAIDDILLVAEYMPEEEIKNQVVVYLPFRG